ncbi:hypothetical protein [Pseudobacteriovorax antillogorgiicola]|uniref:Uncharacterized protein n=1 Tax=Pseudobacteriovorax antillogorgiicola TaxID=1513793 RepID=A0A1Y6CW31_9BACT|nr:hypothetical protein [Pseudobacteriovorax antillogorgiicola]TCS43482.1 hypothetical protein EDD56_13610 [Pseudobacteriovorax antillogorgiicola]SMF81254.1 hypothetical protein SAMN06296036_13636 [Pseudobacteriovorax antillogorgiicola]
MECAAISEDHVVVRILRYDDYYSLFFEDMTILSIPYKLLDEPALGERLSILRSQEYGFVMTIRSEQRELSLI